MLQGQHFHRKYKMKAEWEKRSENSPTKTSTLHSEDVKPKCRKFYSLTDFYNVLYIIMYSVLFSLNLSQTAFRTHARTHVFSFKGADSLWLCCNKSYIAFAAISPLTCAGIRINNIQWINKEVRRQGAISTFRDVCVFQRDPSFFSSSGSHNSNNNNKATKTLTQSTK